MLGTKYVASFIGHEAGKALFVGLYSIGKSEPMILLRQRDPKNFRFTILQRVSPDMDAGDVIRLEGTWKERLHTRSPLGLNDN